MVPKDLFHSIPEISPQTGPQSRQTDSESRQICRFCPYDRPVCRSWFCGLAKLPIASCQMLPHSTFYSPPIQQRKRQMYYLKLMWHSPGWGGPDYVCAGAKPSCRPVARNPCRASGFASPLHEKKRHPAKPPGVECFRFASEAELQLGY